MPRALISTIVPIDGGVPQMTRAVAGLLRDGGVDTTLAYYQPYSLAPALSVPSYRLGARRVSKTVGEFAGVPAHALGAWLPELEFTHYFPTRLWRELMDSADYHLSVSGNCLAATPFLANSRPFWSWVATPWEGDRTERVKRLPWSRRLVDRLVVERGARRLERRIVAAGSIVALSDYTKKKLNGLNGSERVHYVMPMAVDTQIFQPQHRDEAPTVGFVGRLSDPRKNIELLLQALKWCHDRGCSVRALLIGGSLPPSAAAAVERLGLGAHVEVHGSIERDAIPAFLHRLSAFVVPSHQEGLCIAALEALACAVPVISTRCGGPQEFVVDGETGRLVDNTPEALGDAILEMIRKPEARLRCGENGRALVLRDYSQDRVKRTFWESFERTFH